MITSVFSHRRLYFFAAAFVAATLGLAPAGRAQLVISVNFVGGQGGGGAGTVNGAAGVLRSTVWNNETASSSSAVPLMDSNSVADGSISWSDGGNWAGTSSTPVGNDAALMSGYLDNFYSGSVTVTGLGAPFTTAGYEVIAYFNTDSVGNWGFSVTDTLSNTDTQYGAQAVAAGGNYPLSGPNGYVQSTGATASTATEGNYVVLGDFYGSGFTLTGLSGDSGDTRSRLNGFEIVEQVPEPADSAAILGLLALAAAGVVAHRRRQQAKMGCA